MFQTLSARRRNARGESSRNTMRGSTVALFLFTALSATSGCKTAPDPPAWTGEGERRILVRVDPADVGARESDEMVAVLPIDFAGWLAKQGIAGQVDLASLQVHKYSPQTGAAEPFRPFDSARSNLDRPCRFDDSVLPEEYPSRVGRASYTKDGRAPIFVRKRKDRLFNREKSNDSGKLVWVHTQTGKAASYYAIYFDVIGKERNSGPSPAPWIGDVDVLRYEKGRPLGGLSHFTLATGDLDGDGLFDLVAGAEKGDLMWFPNRGQSGKPEFPGCRILTDEAGPIDTGWYSMPFVFDWNGDGLPDLLVGTSSNVILWWQNAGTRSSPAFRYRGFVQADGKRLEVPQGPAPEVKARLGGRLAEQGANDGYSGPRDYFNQPWVGDWNGDGLPDILTGGYITGMIFQYQCTGRDGSGIPQLRYAGPLSADGKTIDTCWAASPTAHDFDGDGRLELITGSWWWSGMQHDPRPGEIDFLMYFKNAGTARQPRLTRTDLPRIGKFPGGAIARASVVDWNADGLDDLLVNDGHGQVFCFLNQGSAREPRWRMTDESLTIPWGIVPGYALTSSAADVNGDGTPEMIEGDHFFKVSGSPHSPHFERLGQALVDGKPIHHPGPGYGDPEYHTALCDWDGDGVTDLLWGSQQGNLFLHRGVKGKPFSFEPGVPLKLVTGAALKVGPPVVKPEEATDFTTLQGARLYPLATDFDGDGILDIAIAETYRNLWVFRNTRAGGTDALEPGVVVGKMTYLDDNGASLTALDWNQDGKLDILTAGTAEAPAALFINESRPGHVAFSAPGFPLNLPYVFWGPHFRSADWNGDGDQDILIQSEFYCFWAERSFLEKGYRTAAVQSGLLSKGARP